MIFILDYEALTVQLLFCLVIFILWYVGKRIEVRLNKSMENDHNEEIDRSKE